MAGWEGALSNSTALLNLVLDRMESDFAALNPKMRKAYGPSQVEAWVKILDQVSQPSNLSCSQRVGIQFHSFTAADS